MGDLNRVVGQRIRAAREAAKLSQEELGKRLGFSGSAVGYMESGIRKVKLEELPKLAEALGYTVDYFLSDTVTSAKVDKDNFDVVIMRATRTLNPKAKYEIEEFVRRVREQNSWQPPAIEEPDPRTPPLKLLKKLGIHGPAVPVEFVARCLALNVQRVPFDDAVSGMLVLDGSSRCIAVNSNNAEVRQRFTIAHEIAHYWLGHYADFNIDHNDPFSGESTSDFTTERQANNFAAELLMPSDWVYHDYANFSSDCSTLSKRYGVSSQAMWVRLTELGLIQTLNVSAFYAG